MGHEGVTRHVVDFSKPIDTSKLASKSVLITGGASGMGAQMATTFAQYKAHVTIADINEELGQNLVRRLVENGLKVNFIRTDVTSWESQVDAFKSAIKFAGHNSVDVVCAVAGVGGIPFVMHNEEAASLEHDPRKPPLVDAVFDVNAKGVYFTSKLAQHYFGLRSEAEQQQKKVLIMISSLGGYFEFNNAEYCASKWAVRGIFRSIRSMMEDMGYRTNLIAPTVMDTPMSNYFAITCREQGIPVGKVSDVVDAVVRCAADDSINGRALAVGAEKSFDLEDDLVGFNSGKVMAEYHKAAETTGLMKFQKQRP